MSGSPAHVFPGPRVLLVGLSPDGMRRHRVGGLMPGNDHERIVAARRAVQEAGYPTHTCVVPTDPAQAAGELAATLESEGPFAVAVIGSGLRLAPELGTLLEYVVATLTEHSPATRLCFPGDPEEAVGVVSRAARVARSAREVRG